MAGGSKKRKTAEARARPVEPPQRHRKRRVMPTESPVTENEIQPSGFPFILEEDFASPQIMKEIGYYEQHKIKNLHYGQWEMEFGPATGRYAYLGKSQQKEMKVVDSPIYCLKYVERLISKTPLARGLGTQAEILAYRHQVAKTIYAHSTDASTIQMPLPES